MPLVSWGAGVEAGRRVEAVATLAAVLPAALAAAGVGSADVALFDPIRGVAADRFSAAASRLGAGQAAVRIGRYRLLRRGRTDRVYDLVSDPEERRPLAPAPAEVLTLLRDHLAASGR